MAHPVKTIRKRSLTKERLAPRGISPRFGSGGSRTVSALHLFDAGSKRLNCRSLLSSQTDWQRFREPGNCNQT